MDETEGTLRYRFALLTSPAARREFLREINTDPRLARLWSESKTLVVASPTGHIEQAETFEDLVHSHECALTQRLFRHLTGNLNADDWHELAQTRSPPVTPRGDTSLPFSVV